MDERAPNTLQELLARLGENGFAPIAVDLSRLASADEVFAGEMTSPDGILRGRLADLKAGLGRKAVIAAGQFMQIPSGFFEAVTPGTLLQ